jgi:1-acyl-sn-glycerol-3-phosphate acyltransferase
MVVLWSRICRLIVRAILKTLFRVRIAGELPNTGPLLVVANHQGWVDGFLLAAAFSVRAPVRLIADRDGTLGVWWHRAVINSLGLVIAIDRKRTGADRQALEATTDALRRGEIVVIFAEGQVSHAEASLAPFARGVGYLALRTGTAVLPIWLAGTAELYLGRELRLVVGRSRAVEGRPTKEATVALAREVHDDLAALAPIWMEPTGPKPLRWLTNLF